jgi:hypothetical protein
VYGDASTLLRLDVTEQGQRLGSDPPVYSSRRSETPPVSTSASRSESIAAVTSALISDAVVTVAVRSVSAARPRQASAKRAFFGGTPDQRGCCTNCTRNMELAMGDNRLERPVAVAPLSALAVILLVEGVAVIASLRARERYTQSHRSLINYVVERLHY